MVEKSKLPKLTLIAARKNVGLTQVNAAKMLKVSVTTLKNWEKGATYPNQPEIERICHLYNVCYDCLNFLPKNFA